MLAALSRQRRSKQKTNMSGINIRDYLHFPEDNESISCGRLTHDENDELLEAFTLYDKDRDGFIDTRELGTVFRALGQIPTQCEETDIVAYFAQNQCQKIDFITFYKLFRDRRKKFDEDDELRESFRRFDKEEEGYIKTDDLKTMLLTVGEPLTEEEVKEWLADGEHFTRNGKLYYEDYATYMLSK